MVPLLVDQLELLILIKALSQYYIKITDLRTLKDKQEQLKHLCTVLHHSNN